MGKRIEIQLYNARTGESITLPVNPESTDLEKTMDIKTYNILGYGEVSVKGTKQLQRITLSNMFPENDTFLSQLASLVKQLNYKKYDMKETIAMINRWIDEQDVIRVIIADRLNKLFRIERYTDQVKESVASSGYNIDLVEYRNPTDKTEYAEPEQSKFVKLKNRTVNRFIPNTKVATVGKTIYKIAKLNYNGKFDELANINAIVNKNADLTGVTVKMLPI